MVAPNNAQGSLHAVSIGKDYPSDVLSGESLDIDAQGIAHRADGKVVFI